MVGIGDVTEPVISEKLVEVELRGVRQEELVAGGIDDHLGYREPLTIAIGIDDFEQGIAFQCSQAAEDVRVHIVLDVVGV